MPTHRSGEILATTLCIYAVYSQNVDYVYVTNKQTNNKKQKQKQKRRFVAVTV